MFRLRPSLPAARASSEGGDEPLQQPPMPAEATLRRIGDDSRSNPSDRFRIAVSPGFDTT